MKNQYVGDINDFCKYGLLRALTDRGSVPATVAWMLTPDDDSADGRKLGYLSRPADWRWRDPELFDALRATVFDEQARSVAAIDQARILGDARYFSEHVPRDAKHRLAYFRRVLDAAAGSDLIFFDPDNGLEIASRAAGRRGSEKYLLWSELTEAYAAGHSVLVYQHFPRRSRDAFTTELVDRIGRCTGAQYVQAFRTRGVLFVLAVQASAVSHYHTRVPSIAEAWRGVIEACGTASMSQQPDGLRQHA